MENKAKIDPKRFEIIRAYQKGEKIPGITAKFSHISKATIYRWINEFKEPLHKRCSYREEFLMGQQSL